VAQVVIEQQQQLELALSITLEFPSLKSHFESEPISPSSQD